MSQLYRVYPGCSVQFALSNLDSPLFRDHCLLFVLWRMCSSSERVAPVSSVPALASYVVSPDKSLTGSRVHILFLFRFVMLFGKLADQGRLLFEC